LGKLSGQIGEADLLDDRSSVAIVGRRGCDVSGEEANAPIAQSNFIARLNRGRAADPLAVQKRAVL
jgi:hypothetical protein